MNILYNPRWRLGWSVTAAAGAATLVGIDWMMRGAEVRSAMAPTAGGLWLSLALGAALGGAGAIWERYLLVNYRGQLLSFHRTPLASRLSWRSQRTNLLLSGWLLVALLSLIGWCASSGVFVLPALLAVNAVQFAANRKLAAQLDEELRQRAAA